MTTQKILLGYVDNEPLFIQKGDVNTVLEHDIGQLSLENGRNYSTIHWMFLNSNTAGKTYKNFEPNVKSNVFDDILDLYAQAYTLYAAKEMYEFGYGGLRKSESTFIIKNSEKQLTMEQDIQKILDHVWQYACDNKIK